MKIVQKDILTGFECGFDLAYNAHMGFCVRFFNLAVLFLFVDLEIALLIPFLGEVSSSSISPLFFIIFLSTVLFFLGGVLLIELLFGGIK